MTAIEQAKPLTMTITARRITVDLDPETGKPLRTTTDIHYQLDRRIEVDGIKGWHGIIRCEGDRRGWAYTTSLHSKRGHVVIFAGLPGWLPPLPAGWDIPAVEFAADMAEAVAA